MAYFTTSDGLNLFYSDTGTGLPILCLAGLTRESSDFDYVSPHLSAHRLIKMDYRGRGQSDFDPNWRNYVLPVECRDVLELLDHLELEKVAILGTSRGGLNAMGLAASARDRLLGVALNDIGPDLGAEGLAFVMETVGKPPVAKTHAEIAALLPKGFGGFQGVPEARWLQEAERFYRATEDGLALTYDPHLRDALEAGKDQPLPDLWPFFDALAELPVAVIRGANSNFLSAETVERMQAHHPGLITAEVPGRGHVPFLDEPEALAALNRWTEQMT